MTTYSKPMYPAHSFPRNWSSHDLADAVPLRLSELVTLGLVEFTRPLVPANSPFAIPFPRGWRRGYLRSAELPAFVRVR